MSISIVESSVEVFVPYLHNLSALRLAPDMFNLLRQVCEANRHATIACALLAGHTPPAVAENDTDIAGLKARITAAIDFVQSVPRAAVDASGDREVVFTFRSGATRTFSGRSLLLTFSLPQFFFHVTTAYDILRHAGVPLAKPDYLGPPR